MALELRVLEIDWFEIKPVMKDLADLFH